MTDMNDFENTVRHGLHTVTRGVVADVEMNRRLIARAAVGRGTAGGRTGSRFSPAWALPAAAAVVTAAVAGSVLVVRDAASGPSTAPGDGSLLAGTSSPTDPVITSSPTDSVIISAPPTTSITSASTSRVVVVPPRPTTSLFPSGQISPPSGTSSAHSSPSTHSSPPTTAAAPVPATCHAKDTGAYEPPTEQDFVNHILGDWLACSHPAIFTTDEAGLRISADHHWAKLYRNPAGQLVAATDSLNKGTWAVVDVSEMNGGPTFQINFHIAGSGTVITLPTFSTGVTRMHLDNNGNYNTDYVPA